MDRLGPHRRAFARRHRSDLSHRLSQLLQRGSRMTPAVQTSSLSKRYGRKWALRDCTLSVPAGKVVGLVGPNGAGKTTLLQLIGGLLEPTSGDIRVLGGRPGEGRTQLERVGFVAQDAPTYANMSVEKHLRMGAYLNSTWDQDLAESRIDRLGLEARQKT